MRLVTKKIIILLFIIFLSLPVQSYQYDFNRYEPQENDYLKNKVYMKLKSNQGMETFLQKTPNKEYLSNKKIKYMKEAFHSNDRQINNIYEIEFVNSKYMNSAIKGLSENNHLEYIERVPRLYYHDIPNDSLYGFQQHLPQIMAEEAWEIHKGEDGQEVVVAIVDSGVEWKHSDLVNNVWNNLGEDLDNDGKTIEFIDGEWVFDPDDVNQIDDDNNGYIDDFVGWDFVNQEGSQDNDPSDVMGHGTHCAGISTGVTDNSTGIASISWNLSLMCLKHDNNGGNAFESNTYDGIIYAAENGADVINTSWGCMVYSKTHEAIVSYADSLGSIIISSAGNEDWDLPGYPA